MGGVIGDVGCNGGSDLDVVFGEIVYNLGGEEGLEVDSNNLKKDRENVVCYVGEKSSVLVMVIR